MSKAIATRVTEDIYEKLSELASQENMNMNDYLKAMIHEKFKEVNYRLVFVEILNDVVRHTKDSNYGKKLADKYNRLVTEQRG